ncbi:GH25 family lysozyme [Mammaliicoccus sciuri]|uniref:GH25 family lysozyme n=1 Tax=Mammaliicoccus sciuri TaxID=1296 RepID=UPI000D1FC7D4|nr:lysozyme [Mammaliicoccus sciuri]PTJ60206.1 lysozyme [Mammaliicoccus sciuri]RIN85702.1 lysozyme [Mammaliicoccus sciuri]
MSRRFLKMMITVVTMMFIINVSSEEVEAGQEEGTMGHGYKKYIENENQNTFRNKQEIEESSTVAKDDSILDLSEWQGELTSAQVKKLKANYDFIILRAQYGSDYKDATFDTNSKLLSANNMKYGVYTYSMYENASEARTEAKSLYNRAPNASFYINDYEEESVASGDTNASTLAWLNEMRKYSGDKKVLLYSYEDFMVNHTANAVGSYDGYWLASYQETQPEREHVLWQYTDSYYSSELDQNVDANVLGPNVQSSWFIN